MSLESGSLRSDPRSTRGFNTVSVKLSFTLAILVLGGTAQHVLAPLPLVQKDASRQAQKHIDMLADRPECELFKLPGREAGKGSP